MNNVDIRLQLYEVSVKAFVRNWGKSKIIQIVTSPKNEFLRVLKTRNREVYSIFQTIEKTYHNSERELEYEY